LERKKRVMFVISSLSGGGAERVAVLLLERLNREKFEPCLVLFEDRRDYAVPKDIPVFCLYKRGWYDLPKLIWRLSRVYKRWRPHAVLSFGGYDNIVAALAQKLCQAKFRLLLSEHSLPSASPSSPKKPLSLLFRKWLPRWLYPRADRVICVARGVAEDVQVQYRLPIEKIKVIYNPVDIKRISVLAQEEVDHPWFAEKKSPIIISVGRLNIMKGYPYLLKAFARVVAKFPSHLVILGRGEEEQSLKTLAKELGIDGRVAFLGFQKNPFKYLAGADISVFASLSESFGIVITEAMSCGTPVIATYAGGPGETITDGVNGLLVPLANESALAEAMLRLLTDNDFATELAQAGRKRAEDFAVDKIVKQYEELFG